MSHMEYKVGDATAPTAEGPKMIVHVCNDIGGWGRGFVVALSKRWPEPEASYRAWHKEGDSFRLGAVQLVQVEEDLWVANLIGQHKLRRQGEVPPIRYEAIEEGLQEVARWACEHQASVHMPRIGCGLAGGSWEQIEPILQRTLLSRDVAVTVYDLN
ncbi:MAG: Appr-1-p processing protein [Deltaproteobacteria bacterium]|nr:MAG: Appr-1-p processing protein [Deltaproteobacteria bacterium]